jgi:methylmalonyl-CoA/ethylmalonyl-CoA epimerase
VKGIHHLGLAVEDLDEAVATYERLLQAEVVDRATNERQGVEAVAMQVGGGHIELLRPLSEDTPVGKFIARRGPGMHHVAYEVDDLSAELDRLGGEGAELIDSEPREGLFGTEVAFVHPSSLDGVLTELVHVVG